MRAYSILLLLAIASTASAHGFVSRVFIGDKSYIGNVPAGAKGHSPVRQIKSSFPNYGANNVAITCGPESTAGDLSIDANPGDEVFFEWKGGDLGFWPHDTGPMINYMANCGNETCDTFDITKAKWFKIDQFGRKPNNTTVWFQRDIMEGDLASSRIPSTLAPGNYLLRHEIIGLHIATDEPGKAEMYPSCIQFRIHGNEKGIPTDAELISLPGAYKDSDPGLFVPELFNKPDAEYIFPGGPVASFVKDSQSSRAASTSASGGCASGQKRRFLKMHTRSGVSGH